MKPFVKWAGGKTQLIERITKRMPEEYNAYYEPFIGGGALLLSVCPTKAIINDINEQLLNVYVQLENSCEDVINIISEYDLLECDSSRYIEMRKNYNKKIANNELDAECAALMIWINKHCFNGLYRVNSKGLFNVPFNNKTSGSSVDPDNLRKIGTYLKNNEITICHGDFESACKTVKSGDFVYFDSPYVPVSPTASFTDYTKEGFSMDDHKRLAKLFKKLDKKGAKLMLSNHDVPLIYELYKGYNIESVSVNRAINSNANKRKGKEVIITNY